MPLFSPYEVYRIYAAIRAHFTTDYDFHKYNGKIKVMTRAAFAAKPDHYFYEKMSFQHRNPIKQMVAVVNKNGPYKRFPTIVDISHDKEANVQWDKIVQSVSYELDLWLSSLDDVNHFDELFDQTRKTAPPILSIDVPYVTRSLLINFAPDDLEAQSNLIIKPEIRFLKKLRPFVKITDEAVESVLRKTFND